MKNKSQLNFSNESRRNFILQTLRGFAKIKKKKKHWFTRVRDQRARPTSGLPKTEMKQTNRIQSVCLSLFISHFVKSWNTWSIKSVSFSGAFMLLNKLLLGITASGNDIPLGISRWCNFYPLPLPPALHVIDFSRLWISKSTNEAFTNLIEPQRDTDECEIFSYLFQILSFIVRSSNLFFRNKWTAI